MEPSRADSIHAREAAQNPAQYPRAQSRSGKKALRPENQKTLIFPIDSANCESVQIQQLGCTGLEPVTPSV
jgi:hypothetical protein